ncbi:MAG: histidine phosphatase family protein [Desulfobacteraceae bacterium]|nr:histidine phosphatase family protein [Desulfobacteraceae bacterium]
MKSSARIVALILAAGFSSRMGSFKPLASFGDSTMIQEACKRFLKAGIADIRVVVGYRADEITPVLDRLGVRWILNEDYDKEMFSSVLAGIKSFEVGVEAFFLLPGDIATFKPETIQALVEAYNSEDPKIIHPRFSGRRGHPPLIPASIAAHAPPPDFPGGMRALLGRFEDRSVDLDVIDEGILLDCDTPTDYASIAERCSRQGVPSESECEKIWSKLKVPGNVIAHCTLVSELARMLAVHLNMAGMSLNIPLIVAAGRLHDIARGEPDHAGAGAKLLAGLGYPKVARIVASHMDMQPHGASLDEADLVYLADKCVEQDRLVTLDERFEESLRRKAAGPEAARKIAERFANAQSIALHIESVLQRPVRDLVLRYKRGLLGAAFGRQRLICLARHGSIRPPSDRKRFIGQLDLPLNGDGILQAELLAEALRDFPLSAIFCSDLKRSADTARAVAEHHRIEFTRRRDLREIALGRWEGLGFDEVIRDFPAEFKARGSDIVHCPPPGGESFFDCALRVISAFYDILNSTRGDILIVGHAGVNRIILSQVLGRSLDGLFGIDQEYGCLNLILQRYPEFELKLQNGSLSEFRRLKAELHTGQIFSEGKIWES